MRKKYFIIITIFLTILISCTFTVKVRAEEVTDRQIAIVANMVYGNFGEGKTVAEEFANREAEISYFSTRHELDDWYIEDYTKASIANMGLTAATLVKDNNIIIAFRGTDSEYLEDFFCGMTNFHTQEIFANDYVDKVMDKYSKMEDDYKIYVTGHSLGGFLAQTAGSRIEQKVKNYSGIELAKIVDFNAMSLNFIGVTAILRMPTINTLKKLDEEGKLIEYCVLGDIVSAGGVHYGEIRTILPSIDTITDLRNECTLFDGAQKVTRVSSIITKIVQGEKVVNLFKTETDTARDLYQVDSIIGYLNVTHKQPDFTSLNLDTSKNDPYVVIKDSKGNVIDNEITLGGNEKLIANTYFASCKTYKWYLSEDGENWGEPVKVCSLYEEMGKTEKIPTNTYDMSLDNGKEMYCKIESYYDDKYTVSRLNGNWYKDEENQPTDYNQGKVEKIIKVTSNKDAQKKSNITSKINLNTGDSNSSGISFLNILKNIGKGSSAQSENNVSSGNIVTDIFNKIGSFFRK